MLEFNWFSFALGIIAVNVFYAIVIIVTWRWLDKRLG